MTRIKEIEEVAKKLASKIIKDKKVDPSDKIMKETTNLFGTDDANEILETINDPKFKKDHEIMARIINKSKKQDWKTLEAKTPKNAKLIYFKKFSKIAAIFICTLGIAYAYLNFDWPTNRITPVNIKTGAITLKLDNGQTEIISETGERKIISQTGEVVGNQKGTNLTYAIVSQNSLDNTDKEIEKPTEKLKFNELTIPYGKTFQITLSDGTKVYLNSGSFIKYPVKFLRGMDRKVSIIGEAYFDVAKDKEHPFIVTANDINVRVLGTKFNISSYPEDAITSTVLVEGAVSLYQKGKKYSNATSTLLTPGKKASWHKKNNRIRIKAVNTDIYTSWIDGKIVFEHMKFHNIIKKLERHYDVKISCNNQKLFVETFTATFDIETIEQVLNSFAKNSPFSYTKKENQIIIH
ncbi:FecR family protein [Flavicella sediminum]|uniref:FecR family protein n=1 Tax=Flavicella sediminum TaxID=2585141 RepID=UPI00111DE9FD|nr:FecR family protein [Flavicella sediminum]